MTTIQIRVDDALRTQAQRVAGDMGLDLSSSIRLFLTQMVRCNGLPFQPRADAPISESAPLTRQEVAAVAQKYFGLWESHDTTVLVAETVRRMREDRTLNPADGEP